MTVLAARRTAAALVDAVLVPAVVVVVAEVAWWSGLLGVVGVTDAGWAAWSGSYPAVAWTVLVAAVAYHALCTARWQATVGKRIVGLAVVAEDGTALGPGAVLWRAAWNAAVFAPAVLAPAAALISGVGLWAPGHRSLGDRAAGTRVVRVAGRERHAGDGVGVGVDDGA